MVRLLLLQDVLLTAVAGFLGAAGEVASGDLALIGHHFGREAAGMAVQKERDLLVFGSSGTQRIDVRWLPDVRVHGGGFASCHVVRHCQRGCTVWRCFNS